MTQNGLSRLSMSCAGVGMVNTNQYVEYVEYLCSEKCFSGILTYDNNYCLDRHPPLSWYFDPIARSVVTCS